MLAERASGILLHPTSLPSRGGIGDFGPAAYQFIDFLAEARQRVWQILPLGPAGWGNSPYSAISAFAGNPLLISLERLVNHGWLDSERLADLSPGTGNIDYYRVKSVKIPLLREAATNFLARASATQRARYDRFSHDNSWWLEDFVLFAVLRRNYPGGAWERWPRALVHREPAALEQARRDLQASLDRARVTQFFFYEQWSALRRHCARQGIRIIGDVAIFVSYDSADVWTHPEIFRLNGDLLPEVVAGVPPDAFSSTGQRWGNPLYRWDVLRQRGYNWWIERMRWAVTTCDIVRLDHFRGFEKYWEIPAHEETAVQGRWVEGPGDDLFNALREKLGALPFIAEDLGYITPEVHALRERLQVPGMRVMQFGFGDRGAHIYLPHRFEPNSVVYTGTHDNDTMLGWWRSIATPEERRLAAAYLGASDQNVAWSFVRAAATSVARLCVFPMQDVLGLGSEARMNIPSRPDGNWTWRLAPDALTCDLAERLATLVDVTDRDPYGSPQSRGSQPGSSGESASGEHGDREASEDVAA